LLAESETLYPIAAKIFKFGPLVNPMLEDLLTQPLSGQARDHTATLLLELGSKAGVPHLLSVLENHGQNSPMAALVLGKARIREAAPLVRDLLEGWDCGSDPYTANTFILALKKLNGLDDALKQTLRQKWPIVMKAGLEKLLAK